MRTVQVNVAGIYHSMLQVQVAEGGIASYPLPMALVGSHWLPLKGFESEHPAVWLTPEQAVMVGL